MSWGMIFPGAALASTSGQCVAPMVQGQAARVIHVMPCKSSHHCQGLACGKLKGQYLLWGWNGSRGNQALVALWGRVEGGLGSSPQEHQEVALLVP